MAVSTQASSSSADFITRLLADLSAVAHAFGVSRVADVTGLDTVGIPVASAIRPAARSLSVSSGRGTTPEAAKVAALMEAFEAHCAETYSPPCVRGTYAEAAGQSAVDPSLLPHHAGADLSAEMWWCQGRWLLSENTVQIPFEALHTDWSRAVNNSGFVCDSTGIGAGLTQKHAILHGLYEVIERDAMSLAAAEAQARGAALPVTAPVVETPTAFTPADTVSARCVLIPSDTRVPVVAAYVWDTVRSPFRPLPIGMGSAAGPTVENAALRALTEAAQSRLITIAGARDDLLPDAYAEMLDTAQEAALRERLETSPSNILNNSDTLQYADQLAGLSTAEQCTELSKRIRTVTDHDIAAVQLGKMDLPSGSTLSAYRVCAPGMEGAGSQFGSPSAPGPRAQEVLA